MKTLLLFATLAVLLAVYGFELMLGSGCSVNLAGRVVSGVAGCSAVVAGFCTLATSRKNTHYLLIAWFFVATATFVGASTLVFSTFAATAVEVTDIVYVIFFGVIAASVLTFVAAHCFGMKRPGVFGVMALVIASVSASLFLITCWPALVTAFIFSAMAFVYHRRPAWFVLKPANPPLT